LGAALFSGSTENKTPITCKDQGGALMLLKGSHGYEPTIDWL
jgi:hypothetical protein